MTDKTKVIALAASTVCLAVLVIEVTSIHPMIPIS